MKSGSRNHLKLIILKSILQLKSTYSRNLSHKLQNPAPTAIITHHTNIQYKIFNSTYSLFPIPYPFPRLSVYYFLNLWHTLKFKHEISPYRPESFY